MLLFYLILSLILSAQTEAQEAIHLLIENVLVCYCTEFWERYVRWLEGKGMLAEAQAALQREMDVFCKARPEAHLFGARFEEQHGRVQVCVCVRA